MSHRKSCAPSRAGSNTLHLSFCHWLFVHTNIRKCIAANPALTWWVNYSLYHLGGNATKSICFCSLGTWTITLCRSTYLPFRRCFNTGLSREPTYQPAEGSSVCLVPDSTWLAAHHSPCSLLILHWVSSCGIYICFTFSKIHLQSHKILLYWKWF